MVVEHPVFRTRGASARHRTGEGLSIPRPTSAAWMSPRVAQPAQEPLEVERGLSGRVAGNEARDELVDRHGGGLPITRGVPMRRVVSSLPSPSTPRLWDEPTTGIGLYTRCLGGALEGRGRAAASASGPAARVSTPAGAGPQAPTPLGAAVLRLGRSAAPRLPRGGQLQPPPPPGARQVATLSPCTT